MSGMKRCLNCMKTYGSEFDICPHCGYFDGSGSELEHFLNPGTIIKNRYQIGTVIGSGGFGITYVGWDTILQLKIAIKEYYPNSFANRTNRNNNVSVYNTKDKEQYNAGLKRFLDEARSLAKFSDEKEIVHVYDYVEANNTAYLIMEYIEGETLNQFLKREEKVSVDKAIDIIKSIANGLEKIHSKGLIHRDISPDNIMISKNGTIKLLDFGAARFFTSKETQQFSVILKPNYAPPEQYSSTNKQDARVDIYALGALLYVLLTGVKPQESAGRMYEDELKPIREIDPELPEYVETIVIKCMALKANDRYQNVLELKKAFDYKEVISSEDNESVKSVINVEKKGKENKQKNKKLLIIPAVLIVVVIACIAFLNSGVKDIKGLEDGTEIYIGDTLKPEYVIEPKSKSDEKITFEVKDENIVNVNSSGHLTANKVGETTVIMRADGYEEIVNVVVKVKVTDIYNIDEKISLVEGNTKTINPKLKPDKFSNCKIKYEIKNTNIAVIDETGKITAKSPGTTELIIKSGGRNETVKITVTEYVAPVESYSNSSSNNSSSNNSSTQFYNDFEEVW